jgi:hypothetical protein
MAVTEELNDQMIKDYKKAENPIREIRLLKQFTKRLIERAIQPETTERFGYVKNTATGNNPGITATTVSRRSSGTDLAKSI